MGNTESHVSAGSPAADTRATLLLQQLHQVQEELELHYLRCLDLDAELQLVQVARDDAVRENEALRSQLASLQRELAALGERTGPGGSLPRRLARWLVARLAGRTPASRARPEVEAVRKCEWFDADWYLAAYGDVREARMDPAEHYCDFGWKEGRNPGPGFDTAWYLRTNPDVASSGLNPLSHFLEYGRKEGRTPRKN